MREIIRIGIQKAIQSHCSYKVSAIALDKNGKYLGKAMNSHFLEGKGRGRHAEKNVIARYGKNIKTILIFRVNNVGNLMPIDPCENCKRLADKLKIKIVSVRSNACFTSFDTLSIL